MHMQKLQRWIFTLPRMWGGAATKMPKRTSWGSPETILGGSEKVHPANFRHGNPSESCCSFAVKTGTQAEASDPNLTASLKSSPSCGASSLRDSNRHLSFDKPPPPARFDAEAGRNFCQVTNANTRTRRPTK